MNRLSSTNIRLIALFLLVAIFSSAQASEIQKNKKQVDPLIKKQRRAERIENSLPPVIETSCGKVLCTKSPKYPKAAMTKVVDEARKILESGGESELFTNRGITLESFESKTHDSETQLTEQGNCAGNRKLIYPLEGYNRRHDEYYYIVNVPSFRQGVCSKVCTSNALNYQGYSEEKLVVLPKGQRHFSIENLKIRKIVIPHDCRKRVF